MSASTIPGKVHTPADLLADALRRIERLEGKVFHERESDASAAPLPAADKRSVK